MVIYVPLFPCGSLVSLGRIVAWTQFTRKSRWLITIRRAYSISHRPWVGGIAVGPRGAYSVALSGGYEDDVDLGEGLYV